jgi:hypothetical protein
VRRAADHLGDVADRAAADETTEKTLLFGGALTLRQAEVDDLLLAIMPQPKATNTGRRITPAPVSRASTTPSSISTRY